MTVNIQATFTKDEKVYNGLEAIRDQLIKDAHQRVVIVAVLEVTNIDTDVRNGGAQTPKVRFPMIEALSGDSAVVARQMLDARYAERTGQGAPPDTLFDAPSDTPIADEVAGRDPTAGPWPGDADYPEEPTS